MEADINPTAMSVVLILMAVASLFTMVSLNQINYIVHGTLYDFGLQFSYRWAMPYWVYSGVVFGLSWVNISISIIVTLYIFKKSRKQALDSKKALQEKKLEEKEQRKLSEYVELKEEKRATLKEESVEVLSEKIAEEEARQTEETIDVAEAQVNSQATEEETEPNKDTEEAPVPPEDVERQSIL